MKCPKHGMMSFVKEERNVNVGIRGEYFIEEHFECKKCSLKGAQFTRITDNKRKK